MISKVEPVIEKVFSLMGYTIMYINGNMLFGYENCKPLGNIIQINSPTPMNEWEIDFHLKTFLRNYPELPLPVIFNMGGFSKGNGDYKGITFTYLMDVKTIEQIMRGKKSEIFDNILLKIICEKGKPEKGTSLEKWANDKANRFHKKKLPIAEAIALSNIGVISKAGINRDTWMNSLNLYLDCINNSIEIKQIPNKIKEWVKTQFELLKKGQLSQHQIQQLNNNKVIWSDKYPLHKKYKELFGFIEKNNRLPFDYECKLYDFMQAELKSSHMQAYRLHEVVSNFDTDKKGDWQNEFEKVIGEYNSVGKDLSKMSLESIAWLNKQKITDDNDSIYRCQKLKTHLKWTGETYDFNWLMTYRKYAELQVPTSLKSELWLWGIRQRVPNIEKYKHNLLKKIDFDFKGITNRWYECYECFSTLDEQSPEVMSSIKKDNIYWAYLNRKNYAEGILEKEKETLLKEAGFDFREEEFDWILKFEQLQKIYDISKTGELTRMDENLKHWCSHQRKRIAEISLTIPQAQKLCTIGFIVSDPEFEEFIIKINQVVAAQEERKRLPLNYKTFDWISENPFRLAYAREIEFYLSPERAMLADQSMAYYELLLDFWTNETKRWEHYISKIQECADYLRDVKKKGILDNSMIRQLNSVGFQWEENKIEEWLFMLSKCQRFIKLYNHVPRHESKDCKIWRFTQLSLYKARKLSEFKKKAFESVRTYTPVKKDEGK